MGAVPLAGGICRVARTPQESLRLRCKVWDLRVPKVKTSPLFLHTLQEATLCPTIEGHCHLCLGKSPGPKNIWLRVRLACRMPTQHPQVFFRRLKLYRKRCFLQRDLLREPASIFGKVFKRYPLYFYTVSLYKNNCLEIWCWLFGALQLVFQEDLERFSSWMVGGLYFLK